ncbi:MarR family winged helix-turn-helix transcriptional regulator [Actinoplanes philippinensis]|uniref:MarR family winged helix-turn-helix transcriptional regulator n=1 Tax=Actinoplanes philippinensis TaxID=35752 RepID=UPI0034060236
MNERRGLMDAFHDLLKAIRLLKQQQPTIAPLGMLAAISRHEPAGSCHMKELAAEHALDPSTVSRAVAGLVRDGLVLRVADPTDGRASTLQLTDRGATVLDEVRSHYERQITAALRDWTPEEITTLTTSLNRFANDLILEASR